MKCCNLLFIFLLICVSKVLSAPPLVNNPIPIPAGHLEKPQKTPDEKSQIPQSALDSSKKVDPSAKEIPHPKEKVQPPTEDPKKVDDKKTEVKKHFWLDLRQNVTLLQRFNQTLLNETLVPLLKKCDSIENINLVPSKVDDELNLCPIFYDNLLRLNATSAAINSTNLEEFTNTSLKSTEFCDDFKKYVNSSSTNFNYSKAVEAMFSKNMERACYSLCFEPNTGPLRKSCIFIAYMSKELKEKTEVSSNDLGNDQENNVKEADDDSDPPKEDVGGEDDHDNYDDERDGDSKLEEPIKSQPSKTENEEKPAAEHRMEVVTNSESFNSQYAPNIEIDNPDASAMKYFAGATFILCVVYFGWHYRSKILGLIVEGRRSQRGRGGRGSRKHTAAYRKLDSNLEEAINSSTSSRSNSQIIY